MINETCGVSRAPVGYYCSRDYYHSGPCAARLIGDDGTVFTKEECKILHTLVDGYSVGPDARKVLDKLKEAAE